MNIEKISTSAASVAVIHADLQAAKAEEAAAEVAILERVIEAVRPALRGLSGRLVARDWAEKLGTASACQGRDYHETRAVHVAGDAGSTRDFPKENYGDFTGCGLYLTTDGTWVELTWSGRWSRYQGDGWAAIGTPRTMTTTEVVAEYDTGAIVRGLAEALSRYLEGKATDTARKSRERAAKLQALAALLG
jgi:hypothetical protein